jgi:type III secretory pathway component EscV
MPKGEPAEVFNVTGAQRALSDEQVSRQRRYLISMGIRTACVLAAIVIPGWPRWMFIAGAVVLPYLAVVIANAGKENDEPGDLGVAQTPLPALPMADRALEGIVIDGSTIHENSRGAERD